MQRLTNLQAKQILHANKKQVKVAADTIIIVHLQTYWIPRYHRMLRCRTLKALFRGLVYVVVELVTGIIVVTWRAPM
jgi:hypothetical protein